MGLTINIISSLILIGASAECANILFFAATPSYSHQVMFQPVWRELSRRGHKVVTVSPNPLKDPTLTNLTEVDISSLYDFVKEMFKKMPSSSGLLSKSEFLTVFLRDPIMTSIFHEMNKLVFDHPNTQKLLNNGHTFDVVIIEWLYPTFAALGSYFNAPIIGITSLGAPIPALDTVGNPSHPVYAPDHNLPVTRDMPFKERLLSALWAIYVRINYHTVILPREDKLARKYLGDNLPYLGDIEKNISLLLLNRNPVFHKVMPVVPSIIELGYMKQNKTLKALSPELQKFVDNSNKGVIYFSLGSNFKVSNLPNETIKEIFNALASIPYNVVLKWNGGELTNVSKNIFLTPWVSQSTLLAHQNVKLFITQGGLQSSDEAIINQIPIIGIPFAHDQLTNVDTMVKYGMGELIKIDDVTAEKLSKLIKDIIGNRSYKENVIKLSKLYTDQPRDALERAVWWIEYVIRHKGAAHLRSSSMDLPWYQYLMLDIWLFIETIILIAFLCIYLLYKFFSYIVRKFMCKIVNKQNQNTQTEEKAKKA